MEIVFYFSAPTFASMVGRSPRTLRRWRTLRFGPQPFLLRGRPHYRAGEVHAWLRELKGDD